MNKQKLWTSARIIACVFTWALFQNSWENPDLQFYWVSFTDKADSPFSISRPEEFLSARAIERRRKQGVLIAEDDLPVSPYYLIQLKREGAEIRYSSRWFNGVNILCGQLTAEKINAFPFVKTVSVIGNYFDYKLVPKAKYRQRKIPKRKLQTPYYGAAEEEIRMLGGVALHEQGFKGEGMMVGILDAGFFLADRMPFFDSLRFENRMLFAKDFVEQDESVFETSIHGTQVLSVMAANVPGRLVGTAPEATYVCIKTEDIRDEYRMEEYNWIAGLEYADQMGVDVVNSSVGYSLFTNKKMNYSIEDMDGATCLSSAAAEIAFSKGMIVVTSAGNEGNLEWQRVVCPADSEGALAIGAVNPEGEKTYFSSIGPTADGRIKPDLVAQGEDVAVVALRGLDLHMASGTSFSAPLVAGMIASLWQAFPEKKNREIVDAIKRTASRAGRPNNSIGFGIPNFFEAWLYLKSTSRDKLEVSTQKPLHTYK